MLNIYEDAFKKNNKNGKDLRWRIEHAQHISAADIPRFGQLGVIAAMQSEPLHVGRAVVRAARSAPSAPKKARTSGRSS